MGPNAKRQPHPAFKAPGCWRALNSMAAKALSTVDGAHVMVQASREEHGSKLPQVHQPAALQVCHDRFDGQFLGCSK